MVAVDEVGSFWFRAGWRKAGGGGGFESNAEAGGADDKELVALQWV